ncbi:hypothetical protein M1615_05175 [Patescibacteria group bacterium]|nr:hypothetical protein [Patescibacteria group bacterium]MCL5010034.1 hypothetical protein [Patescibacteria group bacterium]
MATEDTKPLARLANVLISAFEREEPHDNETKLKVNPIVSQIAYLYEKLRNVMEYREEEVILRSAIERILKRRLLLGGNPSSIAEPLLRELLWARYIPDGQIGGKIVEEVNQSINYYLTLRQSLIKKEILRERTINEWIYQLVSSDIAHIVNPNTEREIMASFMFQILRYHVTLLDETTETRDAQVLLAIRKAFNRDDIAFLRYQLFRQFFGERTKDNLEKIAANFMAGYKEINRQIYYPAKDSIYSYIKRRTPPFLILEDALSTQRGNIRVLVGDTSLLKQVIFGLCRVRYQGIASKVRRAVVRSVTFVLLTKALIAILVESTYERIFYGQVFLGSMLLNIAMPSFLMVLVGVSIRIPADDNSRAILKIIEEVLYEDSPVLGDPLVIKGRKDQKQPLLNIVFTFLWFLAFFVSFGAIVFILTKLHFNIVSQGVFLLFLAVVSFLSYRIILTANMYNVLEKQSLLTPLIDFFFMPIVRVGRNLTEGVSQISIVLFVFDFLIEAPFKGLFSFFEQWFLFLRTKREELSSF